MALSDLKKALHWGAFFVFWLTAQSVLADYCSMPGIGQQVVSKQVIDGDTLDLVDGRRVRLIGINTPEIGRHGEASEPYAQAARKELLRLVRDTDLRLVVGEEPQDRYGRTLGHLFDADGANIEARLLRQGLGFTVAIPPNLLLLNCQLQQEKHARMQRLGVWRDNPVRAASQVSAGGFQLVRGRIEKISRTASHVWMDLDGPLTLRLPIGLVGSEDVAGWKGRQLEVRGWVIDRGQVRRGQKRYMLPVPEWRLITLERDRQELCGQAQRPACGG